MTRRLLPLLLLCPSLGFSLDRAEPPHARAELVSDHAAVAAGTTFRAGVRFVMEPGWHIYGRPPGESGMATSLRWTLPPGFSIEELPFPPAKRLVEAGIATNVYENEVVLGARLTAPGDLKGEAVLLRVLARWLECKDVCLPGEAALELSLPIGGARPDPAGAALFEERKAAAVTTGFWAALLLAFLGGTLLNLMPCVLPVLSIKVLTFVNQAHGDPAAARRHGLAYTAGVVSSFWALAGIALALKAGGSGLGWGFQLQSPAFVAFLALLFLLLSLNLFGLFEVGASLTRLGGVSGGPFLGGVLAVAVATPCTAPFMGTALGYALAQPAPAALAVFTALGVGMAWPYLLLASSPPLLRFVPRPGPWMGVMKKAMGLLLLGTALWLGWVWASQTGRRPALRGDSPASSSWEPFSPAAVERHRAAGRPVFVDFTAAWCLTCQVNERTTLAAPAVTARFKALNAALLKADWTNREDAVTEALAAHGRRGVPLYVLYPADRSRPPMILPTILTPGIVIDALNKMERSPS